MLNIGLGNNWCCALRCLQIPILLKDVNWPRFSLSTGCFSIHLKKSRLKHEWNKFFEFFLTSRALDLESTSGLCGPKKSSWTWNFFSLKINESQTTTHSLQKIFKFLFYVLILIKKYIRIWRSMGWFGQGRVGVDRGRGGEYQGTSNFFYFNLQKKFKV